MATNAFQFGFTGDDIEEDPTEKSPMSSIPENSSVAEELPQNDPKVHSLEDLVCKIFMLSFLILFRLRHLNFSRSDFGVLPTFTLGEVDLLFHL